MWCARSDLSKTLGLSFQAREIAHATNLWRHALATRISLGDSSLLQRNSAITVFKPTTPTVFAP
jgi:hypothetical protein